jgi:hypothetical protein
MNERDNLKKQFPLVDENIIDWAYYQHGDYKETLQYLIRELPEKFARQAVLKPKLKKVLIKIGYYFWKGESRESATDETLQ